jgi:hypothetical protein
MDRKTIHPMDEQLNVPQYGQTDRQQYAWRFQHSFQHESTCAALPHGSNETAPEFLLRFESIRVKGDPHAINAICAE